jgi:O-antigen ligase
VPTPRLVVCAALLFWVLIFGGGGAPSPLAEALCIVGACIAIAVWAWLPRDRDRHQSPDWPLLCLALSIVAIPLVQLVPLPPSLWTRIPARTLEAGALMAANGGLGWMPLSLDPADTLWSALSLIPPVTIAIMVSRLGIDDRTTLMRAFVAAVLVHLAVGAMQMASGDANWLRFYERTHYGFLTGLFANRNASVDLFLVGLLAVAGLSATATADRRRGARGILALAMLIVIALAAVLTGSRAGTLLLLPVAGLCLVIGRQHRGGGTRSAIAAGLVMLVLAGGAFALRDNPVLDRTWRRFGAETDQRPALWADTRLLIGETWPAGTGVGTFVPVFIANEPLERVDDSVPNRAHSEYLEFLLEAGIAAVLLIAALCVFVLRRAWLRLRLRDPVIRVQIWYAIGVIAVFALHAAVDYPMRTIALASTGAMALGMLAWHGPRRPISRREIEAT